MPNEQISQPTTTFEEAVSSLQQIVSELESGNSPLDISLLRFEEGIGLLRHCYQYLDQAEQRIEQLVTLDDQGNCSLVPFDATATVEKGAKANSVESTRKSPARDSGAETPRSTAKKRVRASVDTSLQTPTEPNSPDDTDDSSNTKFLF